MAATPAAPPRINKRTVRWLIPPSANTGNPALTVSAANRSGPIGRPADGLALGKTGETNTASAPERRALTIAASEWAAAVTIQVGRDRLVPGALVAARSGRCTPSAPIRAARPESAPASTSSPRRRAAFTSLRPFAIASGSPKAR